MRSPLFPPSFSSLVMIAVAAKNNFAVWYFSSSKFIVLFKAHLCSCKAFHWEKIMSNIPNIHYKDTKTYPVKVSARVFHKVKVSLNYLPLFLLQYIWSNFIFLSSKLFCRRQEGLLEVLSLSTGSPRTFLCACDVYTYIHTPTHTTITTTIFNLFTYKISANCLSFFHSPW